MIEELDLCIILSNILRNAVEELNEYKAAGMLCFEIRQGKRELFIKEYNTMREDSKRSTKKQESIMDLEH